jgi:hypothetical protein
VRAREFLTAGGGVLDPVRLLLGDRDVVEHRLHVAGLGADVVAHLAEERGHALRPEPGALGPKPMLMRMERTTHRGALTPAGEILAREARTALGAAWRA